MSDMEDRTPREDVLVGGLDDWADAGWVYSSTRLAGVVDAESRRILTIGLIAELIVEGLMIPGDVDEQGHHPWMLSRGEAIERIAREWLSEWREEIPTPGAIVWLDNTETGDAIARSVLARESDVP